MNSYSTAAAIWLHHVFVEQFSAWVLLGFIAQTAFGLRFVLQWIASEKAKRSVVPTTFWTFSVVGGALLLIYAIHRGDPVFIIGQLTGLFIYGRNIWLIAHENRALAQTA